LRENNQNHSFSDEVNMYHYTESGLCNVWLMNGYVRHNTPWGDGIAFDDVEGLHEALAHSLVMRPGCLADSEIRLVFQKSGDRWQQVA